MLTNHRKPISEIILEEIALEGLEGATLECLWQRIADALNISYPICDHLKNQLWHFIINSDNVVNFYVLPKSRPFYVPYDRFSNLDAEYGIPIGPKEFTPLYAFNPISELEIRGSCEFFNERTKISINEIKSLSWEDVEKKWGNQFVVVGTQEIREYYLIDHSISQQVEINNFQYCFLEYIGRSRYNGESTAGKRSLQNICNDSTIIFYVRNKLVSLGFLKKQVYTEKSENRLMTSSLLTLSKFYRENKTAYEKLIERFFNILNVQPNKTMPYALCRSEFPDELHKNIKKVIYTPYFRKLYEITNVTEGDQKPKTIIRLKNPEMTMDELWSFEEKNDNDEEPDDIIEFVDESNFYFDMPLIRHAYETIDKFGKEGCSQIQLKKYMALSKYTVRAVIKTIINMGIVTTYLKDMGRQRIKIYVTVKNTVNNESTSAAEKVNDILANLKCEELPEHLNESKITNIKNRVDTSKIEATCKEVNWSTEKSVQKSAADTSLRQMRRKNAIVSIINDKHIVPLSNLKNIILKNEYESGYKYEICKKSVVRCLHWLCNRNIVRYYEINLKLDENSKTVRYVCHPSIDPNHPMLLDEIDTLKNEYLLLLEDRKQRREIRNSPKSLPAMKKEQMTLLNFHIRLPKFLISRFFHEFLFYLTYEMQADKLPIAIDDEVINRWNEFNPKADYLTEIKGSGDTLLYQNEVNWKMFIPPLPKYEEKPNGWVYLPDVIERIPLSVFSKIFQIDRVLALRTNECLHDPILQHLLVKCLPSNEMIMIDRLRVQCTYMTILKVLNNTGLIQVGQRHFKDPLQIWVYSNRKARLLDTTTSEPSKSCISDKNYETIDYYFENLEVLQNYWTTLHRISLHTKLGCMEKTKSKTKKNQKSRNIITLLPAVSYEEAAENDTGIPPGDKVGAAGIDSRLSSYLGVFWSWRIPIKKTAKPLKIKTIRSRIFVTKVDNKPVKKRTRVIIGARKKALPKPKTKRPPKPKLRYVCDDIDKEALKHMSSIRVKWSVEEDNILKMSRVAYLYLNPSVNFQSSSFNLHEVSKIQRDLVHSILNSKNKTSMACLRRAQFLMKRIRNTPEIPLWLHILEQNTFIQSKYGSHFFKNLQSVYTDPEKFATALKVHFVLLVGYLMQLIKKTTSPFHNSNKSMIPDTIKEFRAAFRKLYKLNDTDEILHHNPLTEEDVHISTLDNLLHSSLCCTRDKTTYEIQLFEIYKNYPEEILQKAFKYTRTNGLIVINKRRFLRPKQSQLTQLTGPWYIFSNKYRLQLTYIAIPYNVLDMCFNNLNDVFNIIFGDGGSIKFKATNSGQLFFISELMMSQYFKFDLKIPSNILTFDPNAQTPSISDPERILEHFRQIFENAPKTEYVKYFENEVDKQPTTKFNIANERYKIEYNPYDIISKLPDVYIHFFCALDNLYRPAALNFPNIKVDNVCPFNCILKNDNYINDIERIVQEKKNVIEDLHKNTTLDNKSDLLDSIVIIKPDNLMYVFNTLKLLINEKDALSNQKDFGKIRLQTQDVEIIQICRNILEYNDDDQISKSNEFEPTLNKEERIFKAQDVFVVNLPTIEISLNSKSKINEEFIYKKSKIPKELAQPFFETAKILNKITKEYVWIDNQKTEEHLLEQMVIEQFSDFEKTFTLSVLQYVESNPVGVTAQQLSEKFGDDEMSLVKSIDFLRNEYFVMRVGVESFMYVHKTHLNPWILKTYHIKRLERESINTTSVESNVGKSDTNEEDDDELMSSCEKRFKPNDSNSEYKEKRSSKPVIRYSECDASTSLSSSYLPKDRFPILLRPCPWIRVNGTINRRVLDKLIGSILLECVNKCGCTIKTLCILFNLLHPVDVVFLLEILQDIGCVSLRAYSEQEVSVLTEYQEPREYPATQFTSMENTYICTSAAAVTNISLFIGEKKYTTDFI